MNRRLANALVGPAGCLRPIAMTNNKLLSTPAWNICLLGKYAAVSKFLRLLEEHGKANDRAINQQTPQNTHDHSLAPDDPAMRQQHGQRHAHDDEEARDEPAEVDDAVGRALRHEVVAGLEALADKVGQRRHDVGRYDEEGEVVAVQRGGEDDEEEADG